jgi:hypothetical protein
MAMGVSRELGQKIAAKFCHLVGYGQQRIRHSWAGENDIDLGRALVEKIDHVLGGN